MIVASQETPTREFGYRCGGCQRYFCKDDIGYSAGAPDPRCRNCDPARFLGCDFQPVGEARCGAVADNVGIDPATQRCMAVVCEHHARTLASDAHTAHLLWFVKEKRPAPTVEKKGAVVRAARNLRNLTGNLVLEEGAEDARAAWAKLDRALTELDDAALAAAGGE